MYPQRASGSRRADYGPLARVQADSVPERCIEVCRHYLDALYLLALLYTGEDQLAEEAVVDALVSAAKDPSITVTDPASVWSLLASCFRDPNGPTVVWGSTAATVRIAGLSIAQRETMALIVAGRSPDDVAVLLAVPPAQVQDDFRSGAWALDAAMRSVPSTTATSPAGYRAFP
jgi:hypothetical protein